ncbi:hypothetical protein N9L92_00795 [Saprospiraceae bacterium]|nr:hypothetical protein [Saprospiraceae bacterium]
MKTIFLLLFICSSYHLFGATFTVSNNNDSGAGSFRQSVLDANSSPGNDIIDFAVVYNIILTTSHSSSYDFPPISAFTINGKGSTIQGTGTRAFSNLGNNTVIDLLAFSQFVSGVFLCNPGAGGVVTISNTFFSTNHNSATISQGGCILQFSGDLFLNNNSFWNCSADLGGAICVRFGLSCHINVINISSCLANDFGDAIYMFNESELFLNGQTLIDTNIYRNPFEAGFNAGTVTFLAGFFMIPGNPLQID